VLRVHFYRTRGEMVLAVCDDELLGRTLSEGRMRLAVNEFYDGETVEEDLLPALLAQATNVNLVGDRCVQIAIDLGYVESDGVITIEGVPHAMVFYI